MLVVAGVMFKELLCGEADDEDCAVEMVAGLLQGMTIVDVMDALEEHGGLTLTDRQHIALLEKVILQQKKVLEA